MTKSVETKLELLNQWHDMLKEEIKELKEDTKEGFQKIESLINWLEDKFATKWEHKANARRIDLLQKIIFWVVGTVLTAVVFAVLNSIWL